MKTLPALSLAMALLVTPATPCGFHNYTPGPTMVELMLGSSAIVLARQSDVTPFRYAIYEVLAGHDPGVTIPYLVDTATRRTLKTADAAVLFAYDAHNQTWQNLGLVDGETLPVIERILLNLPDWRMGGDLERAEMFALLLDHPNATIRRLALRELDRVDYSVLRELVLLADTRPLLLGLNDLTERNLEPIRALLLGLSRDMSVSGHLYRGLAENLLFGGPEVGAYATALIELQGVGAVEYLIRDHLSDQSLPDISKELIIEAMALHSSYGRVEVAKAVADRLDQSIRQNPALAVPAARQFLSRYDWSLHDTIADVQDQLPRLSEDDLALVTHYVLMSGAERDG